MSVNKVDAKDGRITLHGDYVIHHQNEVEFSLEGDRIPSFLSGTYNGNMFVTNLRLIFVNDSKTKGYKTFSMEFLGIRNTEVKQPIFGANYLKGFVKSEPNGGWEGNANFKINFPKGGAIEFAEKFQAAVKDSVRFRQNGSVPAPQQPPVAGYYPPPHQPMMQNGVYYPPPQGVYAYQSSAPPPAQNGLYSAPTGYAPPPYSTATGHGFDASNPKAQEAYMNGNNVYVPTDVPPPYNPDFAPKKNQ